MKKYGKEMLILSPNTETKINQHSHHKSYGYGYYICSLTHVPNRELMHETGQSAIYSKKEIRYFVTHLAKI